MRKNQSIIIVTHEMFYGVPHAMRDYLLQQKIQALVFIGMPLVEQNYARISIYKSGKLFSEKRLLQKISGPLGHIINFSLILYWVIRQGKYYDLFIGVDTLSALAGLFLRRITIVKRVFYYALDFTPQRFKNTFLNYLFHEIEKIDVKHADEVWNVSPTIAEGRENFLNISPSTYMQRVVNSGIWIEKVKKFPFNKVKKHQILFLGHLLKKQGIQMVLSAIPEIVKKIPDFHFVIMGGGEYEKKLKNLTKTLKIERYITFTGWIKDRTIIDTTLGESAAAIVTYIPEKEKRFNFSYYGDPIKIKEYLASGLPVIITDVPHNAKTIEKNKCGIVVNYTKEAIANAVLFLLEDQKRLKIYKANAIRYAKKFDWNTVFSRAFQNL